VTTFDIPFSEKSGTRFRAFLRHLADANPSDVYIWTPASNICGVLKPLSLSEFDVAFPFDVNPEGVLVILTADFSDQLLLDYSDEGQGKMLEAEVSGEHWSRVVY